MCKIAGLATENTGYKVLVYKNKSFYSTFTGQRIRCGKVPQPPKFYNRLNDYWNNIEDLKLKDAPFYSKRFAGNTSAFVNKDDTLHLFNQIIQKTAFDKYDLVIVKIVFEGFIHDGHYDIWDDDFNKKCHIIAGNTIKSIEIVTI